MRDDRNRVLIADWNRMKRFIQPDPRADQNYTPTFGYIVDYLRIHYNIFVQVSPMTNADLDIEGDEYPQRIFNYRGTAIYPKQLIVFKSASVTDINYCDAMRKTINLAIGFLEEN